MEEIEKQEEQEEQEINLYDLEEQESEYEKVCTTSTGVKEDNFNRNPDSPYLTITLPNKKGKLIEVDYDGYIIGVCNSCLLRQQHDWDNLIIVTGGVGDGKSSLVEGISAYFQWHQDEPLSFDNVCWTSKAFVMKTDREDNFKSVIWWDEAIQGASGKKMALTKEGDALKNAIVTKRFKKHIYILLIDEIEEYSWKLIKKANAWFHVKSFGLKRGYFDCYTKKHKIQRLYNHFKKYKGTWEDEEVKWVKPDKMGRYMDYRGLFLDETEYDKKKLEETRQIEEIKTEAISKPREKRVNLNRERAFELWNTGKFKSHNELAKEMGMNRVTVSNYLNS